MTSDVTYLWTVDKIVELLTRMKSRGHFLLIKIALYQNVCPDQQFSKIIPEIFLSLFNVKAKGQRSTLKNKGDRFIIHDLWWV